MLNIVCRGAFTYTNHKTNGGKARATGRASVEVSIVQSHSGRVIITETSAVPSSSG